MNSKFLVYAVVVVLHTGLLRGTIKEITCVEDYNRVKNATKPTVIVFNSPSCDACTRMEPFINAASDNPEYEGVDFYSINTQEEALKELPKSEKIPAYPTTLFIKPGKEPRRERGGMSQ
nr:thioredoxin family protein [Candidatus Dependentiae bacterium]